MSLDLGSMEVLDISPRINPRMAVFPGDTPFRRDVVLDIGHHREDAAHVPADRAIGE